MYLVQDAVKIMAKDLVRTRRYVKKFIMMRANIQAVSLKVQVSCHCKLEVKNNGPFFTMSQFFYFFH